MYNFLKILLIEKAAQYLSYKSPVLLVDYLYLIMPGIWNAFVCPFSFRCIIYVWLCCVRKFKCIIIFSRISYLLFKLLLMVHMLKYHMIFERGDSMTNTSTWFNLFFSEHIYRSCFITAFAILICTINEELWCMRYDVCLLRVQLMIKVLLNDLFFADGSFWLFYRACSSAKRYRSLSWATFAGQSVF